MINAGKRRRVISEDPSPQRVMWWFSSHRIAELFSDRSLVGKTRRELSRRYDF